MLRLRNYINGNYHVSLCGDGTKVKRALRRGEIFKASFPDSIDLKVTGKCRIGCPFCHEASTPNGGSFNLERTKKLLGSLPPVGIEVAIGGGDVLEDAENVHELVGWLKTERNVEPRITLNIKDFEDPKFLEDNTDPRTNLISSVRALGISLTRYVESPEELLRNTLAYYSPSIVFHIIAGIFPVSDFERMMKDKNYKRILVLGYKQFGRAQGTPLPESMGEWREAIRRALWNIRNVRGPRRITLGFDNLAIEQLGLEDCFIEEEWNKIYFGDEFSSSMYIDAVEETFAPTSRSTERVPWSDYNYDVVKYFKENRNEYKANN